MSITAEQIPDEVAKAARLGWQHGPKDPIEAFRHAIAAALNAWPGMETHGHTVMQEWITPSAIILPFPQKEEK